MDDYIKTWLYDIQNSIQEIDSYFPHSKKFELYASDIRTKRAVERNIEIIGEAMGRILKENPTIKYQIQERLSMLEIKLSMVMMKFLMM